MALELRSQHGEKQSFKEKSSQLSTDKIFSVLDSEHCHRNLANPSSSNFLLLEPKIPGPFTIEN